MLADTSRPSAAVSALRCKRTRCTFRLRASDPGGSVRGLSVRLARKVTTCRTRGKVRSCTTRTRTRKLTVKRTTSGFSGTAKLTPARYELTAVATDTSGNRSKVTRRSFRVRR